MKQIAQHNNLTQIVAVTPLTIVSDSFVIRSPQFSEGVRRGRELYQMQFSSRDTFAADTDLLRFLVSNLTPFSRYAPTHAGALFGWLHAVSNAQGKDSFYFGLPAFEKAFCLGVQDYTDGSLEDLDCDTELTCFLAQKMSPQFDRDLSATNGELPVELQRIAGYLCGVVMAVQADMTIVERLPYPFGNGPHPARTRKTDSVQPDLVQSDQKHHLLSTIQPYLRAPISLDEAMGLDFEQMDDFSQGYINACDMAHSFHAEGETLKTERDLWKFLSRECNPKTMAREREDDRLHGWEPTPLAYRTGYLAGYLHTMYTLQQAEAEAANARASWDSFGVPNPHNTCK